MNIKGVTLLEESTQVCQFQICFEIFKASLIQVRTTVVITNICYIRLDVNDMKFFGMIIKTKESRTQYKLYVFKTDKATVCSILPNYSYSQV